MIQLVGGCRINPKLLCWINPSRNGEQYTLVLQFMGDQQELNFETREEQQEQLKSLLDAMK